MDRPLDRQHERTSIQIAAMVFGVVFLLVGAAGFIPGITTHYDRLSNFDGEGALLLGIFGINFLESIVHLLYGAVGLAAARSASASRSYFLVGGAVSSSCGSTGSWWIWTARPTSSGSMWRPTGSTSCSAW